MGSRGLGRAGGRGPWPARRLLPLRGLPLVDELRRRAEADPDPERDWPGRPVVLALRRAGRSGSARTFSELRPRGRL